MVGNGKGSPGSPGINGGIRGCPNGNNGAAGEFK